MEPLDPHWKELAIKWHGEQKYGKDKPISYHLGKVEQVLVDFGYDSDVWRAAAWLHDVVEDTEVGIQHIHLYFGWEVSRLVWAVSGFGHNRAERVQNILTKLRMEPDACILKLADRIANVEEGGKKDMYLKEQPAFEHVVRRNVPEEMWARLEKALNG